MLQKFMQDFLKNARFSKKKMHALDRINYTEMSQTTENEMS